MTRTIINGIVRLIADEDKWLTNGETNSKKVFVGVNCSENEWREVDEPVTAEDVTAEEIAAAIEEAMA